MPLGTPNSSIFRRRSGHAALMEIDKTSFQQVVPGKVRVVLQSILSALHCTACRFEAHRNHSGQGRYRLRRRCGNNGECAPSAWSPIGATSVHASQIFETSPLSFKAGISLSGRWGSIAAVLDAVATR